MDTIISLKLVAAYSILLICSWCLSNGAIQKILNELRARLYVYLNKGSSNKFSIRFCKTRLVEDKEVAVHALEVWESVVATVRYWESLCK